MSWPIAPSSARRRTSARAGSPPRAPQAQMTPRECCRGGRRLGLAPEQQSGVVGHQKVAGRHAQRRLLLRPRPAPPGGASWFVPGENRPGVEQVTFT
jgi:hypothetical protein